MGFAVFVPPESSSSVGQQQQRGEQEYGGKMTKNEIIEKTLKEMGTPPLENEPPYCEEREHEENRFLPSFSAGCPTPKPRPAMISSI